MGGDKYNTFNTLALIKYLKKKKKIYTHMRYYDVPY